FFQQVKTKNFFTPEERVLIAVSGGMDSCVLLALMMSLPDEWRPFFAVVHVDHQLRACSQAEQQFLQNYCEEQNIPFFGRKWLAGPTVTANIEAKARTFRYQCFKEIAQEQQFTKIITAHHADDQLETFLLKWLKGSALKDLQAIRPIR